MLHNQPAPADAVKVTLPPWQKLVGPFAFIAATGLGFAVTLVAVEWLIQPPFWVTDTVNVPDVLAVIDWVVAPLLHNQELPADAVSVTLPPSQNVVAPEALMIAGGLLFTVTAVAAELATHPPAPVTATE